MFKLFKILFISLFLATSCLAGSDGQADLSKKNTKKVTLSGYIFENGLNSVKVKRENRKH